QLSGGEQQMLAIGRALLTNPELLILDEATEGLSPLIRQEIFAALAQIKSEGTAILVVDKNLGPLLGLADRHVVVEKGRVAWSGTSAELRSDRRALQRYLSVDPPAAEAVPPAPPSPSALSPSADEDGAATLLETLYVEHRTIVAVLDAMSALLERTSAEGRPLATAPLQAILHYLDVFPERHHHPKEEELLFPAVRAHSRDADAIVERLHGQHVRGYEALRALQQKLVRVELSGPAEAGAFMAAAREFLERYREHIQLEEMQLMPIARRVLPRAEWARLEQQFRQRPDPLLADSAPLEPRTLLQRITALVPAPLGLGRSEA
ncbi:MAG: hemerythrin domain-containing protein, partial [Burkholderiaceae bacterium]|nr:hemerythrin domain-containing protein [Burkholderiaceae bacterium]